MSANDEQISYWNEYSGPSWVRRQASLDAQIGPLGVAAMERVTTAAGERVIDVGCGCGDSTFELARRVAPGGAVIGADPCRPMLERAHQRVIEGEASDGAAVSFVEADAAVHGFEAGSNDLVYSRFGVMFFADPVGAFRNFRRALRPEGRLGFVCWQDFERNDWVRVPIMAAAQHVPLPDRAAPGAPGPFSFADPERVRSILTAAGFAEVDLVAHEPEVLQAGGGGREEVVEFMLEVGPVAGVLRQKPDARPAVASSLREALAPYTAGEEVRMPSSAWLVTAVNPG